MTQVDERGAAEEPTISRSELVAIAEQMIELAGIPQRSRAARDLRKSARESTRVCPTNQWWMPAEGCGCLVGNILGRTADMRGSDYEQALWDAGVQMPVAAGIVLGRGRADALPDVVAITEEPQA